MRLFLLKKLNLLENIFSMSVLNDDIQNKTILLSALDWGMGHTTRCYCVIRDLLTNENTVIFAGDEKQREWIKREFPEILAVNLDGYQIRLDSRKNTYFQLVSQFHQMKQAIRLEKKWMENYCKENKVDLIISDNRYGFYHGDIESIMLTHQLNLQIPLGRSFVNKKIKRWLANFNSIWVPDFEDHRLTGQLSKQELNVPIHYIGPLNRFQKENEPIVYDCLVILSGPEPERSNFLKSILLQTDQSREKKWAFVGVELDQFPSFHNPSTSTLSKLIAKSDTIISRAGYTTIMELTQLQKKGVLYPTKGQYEQEYLASKKFEGITFKNDI